MQSAVAVLHFNQPNQTLKCLESIRQAGVRPERVFVYDNGSLPRNSQTVRDSFPEFNHSGNPQNFGYSGGFNRALSTVFQKDFDSVLFLTNDTRLGSDTLDSIDQFASDKKAFLIAPKIVYETAPEEIDSFAGFFNRETCSLGHYKTQDLPGLLDQATGYIPGTAFWVHREAFQKLGGMDESFHTYWEDADFSFRAHRAGIPIHRCRDAVIRHGVGKTCHDKALYTAFYFQRNRVRFCRKYLEESVWPAARETILSELQVYGKRWRENQDQTRIGYLEEILRELEG